LSSSIYKEFGEIMNKAENLVCVLDIGKEALPSGHELAVPKLCTNQQQGGL